MRMTPTMKSVTEELAIPSPTKPSRPPTRPGEIQREDVLPALGLTVSAAAKSLGLTRQTLHATLAGRLAVTPTMALRLGKLCGNGPHIWLNMQGAYDLGHAEQAMGAEIAKIETHKAA